MSNRNKSEEPFFTIGERFEELGKALQDKRTTLNDVADLALQIGLYFQFSFVTPPAMDQEQPHDH